MQNRFIHSIYKGLLFNLDKRAPLIVAKVNHIGRKRLCSSKTKKCLKIINFINLGIRPLS